MGQWILVIALYLVGIGLFHALGGLAAAGEWMEQWGERCGALRDRRRISTET